MLVVASPTPLHSIILSRTIIIIILPHFLKQKILQLSVLVNPPFCTDINSFIISKDQNSPLLLATQPSAGKFLRQDYLVKKYSAKEIQELIKGDRNVPLIIDFYATWCGPCILMAQELEMLAVEYESNAMIVKVDTDDEYEFARDMQVRGLPTLYFISPDPGKDAIRTEGVIPLQMMRDIIDKDM